MAYFGIWGTSCGNQGQFCAGLELPELGLCPLPYNPLKAFEGFILRRLSEEHCPDKDRSS
jgi:hypothetical protein